MSYQLSEKQKRILTWVGYPLLALVTFVFAVAYTFPYDRLRSKIETALADRYEVDISSIRPKLLPGGVVIEGISLRTIPTRPDEEPVLIFIDRVDLKVGLLAAIGNRLDLRFSVEIGDGTVDGRLDVSKARVKAKVETERLPLETLPGLTEAVGLPMAGGLDAMIDIVLPEGQWNLADGSISLACIGCTIGDGKTTMRMRAREVPPGRRPPRVAFGGEGITVPRLNLGSAMAEVDIQSGTGTIKRFEAGSQDGTLAIEGTIHFRDPFKQSEFPGCMRFKLSDDLKQRERDFGNIEFLLPPQARQPDGTFAIPTKGTLGQLRWNVRGRCDGTTAPAGDRERPTISIRTDDDDPGDVPLVNRRGEDPEETDAERLRRLTAESEEEPEVERPGSSGPILSPSDVGPSLRPGDDVVVAEPPSELVIPPTEIEEEDEEDEEPELEVHTADEYD